MKKRIYRSVDVKVVNVEKLVEQIGGSRVIVGVDVAKEDFKAALMDESQRVHMTVKWKHPKETHEFMGLVKGVNGLGVTVEVAMESSGTYGDALQEGLHKEGVPVFKVSAKRVHDAREVYDGVPSLHDPKCAAIIAKMHLDGASRRWEPKSDEERELTAVVRTMDIYHEQYYDGINRLEARMARYWPEVTQHLKLGSVTLWALLEKFGSPAEVSRREEEAREMMARVSRGKLRPEKKIDLVLESAKSSIGVIPVDGEVKALQELVSDIKRAHKALEVAKKNVEHLSRQHEVIRETSPVVGLVTSAVLLSETGDPRAFEAAASYEKAMGLNLKERSSGKHKGKLKITKRGSGKARRYLYLAALRLLQDDSIAKAWYSRKVERDGGIKMKAVVAVMRKLCRALWHVARGEAFDASKLFDTRRLKLST